MPHSLSAISDRLALLTEVAKKFLESDLHRNAKTISVKVRWSFEDEYVVPNVNIIIKMKD